MLMFSDNSQFRMFFEDSYIDQFLRENTTIILWSDHGYFLGEHGFWCKHSTFQEAVKIPFIISHPDYSKNKTTDSFTELIDVYPTLCEITDIKAPVYIHGKSLVPVLKEPSTILKTEIYTRYKQGEAIIDKDFSYTEFYNGEVFLGEMLFNNKNDAKQNIDISKNVNNHSSQAEKCLPLLIYSRLKEKEYVLYISYCSVST